MEKAQMGKSANKFRWRAGRDVSSGWVCLFVCFYEGQVVKNGSLSQLKSIVCHSRPFLNVSSYFKERHKLRNLVPKKKLERSKWEYIVVWRQFRISATISNLNLGRRGLGDLYCNVFLFSKMAAIIMFQASWRSSVRVSRTGQGFGG